MKVGEISLAGAQAQLIMVHYDISRGQQVKTTLITMLLDLSIIFMIRTALRNGGRTE